jgi:hypothetical protein
MDLTTEKITKAVSIDRPQNALSPNPAEIPVEEPPGSALKLLSLPTVDPEGSMLMDAPSDEDTQSEEEFPEDGSGVPPDLMFDDPAESAELKLAPYFVVNIESGVYHLLHHSLDASSDTPAPFCGRTAQGALVALRADDLKADVLPSNGAACKVCFPVLDTLEVAIECQHICGRLVEGEACINRCIRDASLCNLVGHRCSFHQYSEQKGELTSIVGESAGDESFLTAPRFEGSQLSADQPADALSSVPPFQVLGDLSDLPTFDLSDLPTQPEKRPRTA